MSDAVTFHCFPACCVTQWSVTLVLTSVRPFCRRQASRWSLRTISLCGTIQSGATAGLSHSCSGFDLLPFTSDLSHCGRLPVRWAERDITAQSSGCRPCRVGHLGSEESCWVIGTPSCSGLLRLWSCVLLQSPYSYSVNAPCTLKLCACVPMLQDSDVVKWRIRGLRAASSLIIWVVTAPLSPSPSRAEEKHGIFFTITSMLRENIL